MAKMISPATPRTSRARAESGDAWSPEVRSELIRLAEGLHESGALPLLVALSERSGAVTAEMAAWASQPSNRRMLQNLAAFYRLLQQVDPAAISTVGRVLEQGWTEAGRARRAERPPSLRSLWREWNDPEVRRGLQVVFGFLRGIGRTSDPAKARPPT